MMASPKYKFSHRIEVDRADIDDLGHVNNTVYLQYFEACARAHADHVGATIAFMREEGVVPVARKHTITYYRPALEGEELLICTEIVRSFGVRSTRHYEARRASNGELLAEMETEWVWVDPVRGRPKPVTTGILDAFGLTEERASTRSLPVV